jgi:Holliday junction DNA helicase RuvA
MSRYSATDLASAAGDRDRIAMATKPTNDEIAVRLRRHADDLAARGENLYRVRAFRQAALAVLALNRPATDLGPEGLAEVRGIGKSLAGTIGTFAETGEWVVRTAVN